MGLWCWAATSESIIEFYGISITQTEIVTEIKGSPVNQGGWKDFTWAEFNNCSIGPLDLVIMTNKDVTATMDNPQPSEINGIHRTALNTIAIAVPQAGAYALNVYSLDGKMVSQLNKQLAAGTHTIAWNKSNVGSQILFFEITGMDEKYVIKSFVK